MPQIKKEKYPEQELSEMEAKTIQDAVFKIGKKMLKDLKGRINYCSENLNEETVSIKKDQKP